MQDGDVGDAKQKQQKQRQQPNAIEVTRMDSTVVVLTARSAAVTCKLLR
jgi:hypothetical protein